MGIFEESVFFSCSKKTAWFLKLVSHSNLKFSWPMATADEIEPDRGKSNHRPIMHTLFGMHSHKVRIHTLVGIIFVFLSPTSANCKGLRVATVGQTTPATQAREICWSQTVWRPRLGHMWAQIKLITMTRFSQPSSLVIPGRNILVYGNIHSKVI